MLYAVSGWTAPERVTKTLECYDPQSDSWSYKKEPILGLHEHAGIVHIISNRFFKTFPIWGISGDTGQ